MARRTKEQKRIDDLVNTLAQRNLNGVQVDIMDLGKISDAGLGAAPNGDAAIEAAIKAKIAEVRKN